MTLIEQQPRVAQDVGRSNRWVLYHDLVRYGVDLKTSTRVTAIEENGVVVETDNTVQKSRRTQWFWLWVEA